MPVPNSCRAAFSFTALLLTGCTVAYAVIRRHGRASRAGHAIITLITAGLAAVSIFSAQSHELIFDRATNSLLCAAISASPLIQFETLNEALGPLGLLPAYVWGCIIFARALASFKFAVIITLIIKPRLSNILLSVFLSGVTLEYIFLTMISFKLYKHRAQRIFPPSMALASFVSSILGFHFKDMGVSSWSLWALLLLPSLSQICLLLAHELKKHRTRANNMTGQYYAPEEIQLHPGMPPADNSLSTTTSEQLLVHKGEQCCHEGGWSTLQDSGWRETQLSVSQLSSSHEDCEVAQLCEEPQRDGLTSNTRQYNLQETAGDIYHNSTYEEKTRYHGRNLENIETQQARPFPRDDLGNKICITTDIFVDYGEIAVCGAGYFTNAHDQYQWNYPWSRIGYISFQGADETWKTKSTSCHWRRWPLGAMVE